jgi:hypothetical protein
MLAFVDLIHALPTMGGMYPIHSYRESFASKNGRNAFVHGELAFMHLGALFSLSFSCALLPIVSSPFASP